MVSKEEKEIVLARLQTMPMGLKMSIGGKGTYNKWELMEEIEKGTKTGDFVVEVYMESLRAFKQ